jgi:hypothetical protein
MFPQDNVNAFVGAKFVEAFANVEVDVVVAAIVVVDAFVVP